MSSLNVQDEVTDSGKDDENNVITAPTHNIDNADGDSANVQIDNNVNPTSPKTSEQTSAVRNTNENIGESSSPKNYKEIEVKTLSKTDKSLAGNVESKESITVESGYKETVIDDDDCSDADFELRWSDDENDDKTSLLLSDEALKKLDEELGIDVSHNVDAATAENVKDLEITKKIIDNSQMETDNSMSGIILNIDKNLKQKTKEEAGIVLPELPDQTNETEIVKNIIAVSSVSSENIETTIKQLINVEKDTDVTKQEKIGEIDDNRVNVTSIIAQDKDTIKQIEQDDNKPDNTSVEKEDIVEISDTVQIKAKSGATKSDLGVEELIKGYVKAMEVDYPPKLENEVSAIVSLDDISTSQKENNVSINTIVSTVSEEKENNGSESSPYIIDIPTNVGISSDCKKLEVNAIKHSESMELSENDITIESNADSIQDELEEPNLVKEEMPSNRNATVDKANLTISNISDDFKLNKEHRINRPNVMLDIPTQEFDFNEFDDTYEKQDQCDKKVEIKSDLTTKTITEIVNQMAKENAEGMDIDNNADIVPKVIEQQENIATCSMIKYSNSSNDTSSINMKMETEPCDNDDNEIVQKDLPTLNSEHAEIENMENLENSPAISGTDEKASEIDVVTSDNADIVSEKPDKSLQDNMKATVDVEKLNNQPQIYQTEATIKKTVTIDNIKKSNNEMDIETTSNNIQLDTISIERENLDVEPSSVAEAKKTQDFSQSNEDTLQSKATENVKQTEAELKINEKPDIQTSTSQEVVAEPHEKVDINLRTVITEKEKQNAQPSTSIEATAIKTEIIDFENPESEPAGKEYPLTSAEVMKTKDKDDKKSKDSNDKHVQPSISIEATTIKTEKMDAEKPEIKPTDKEKPSNSVEVIKQKDEDDNKSDVSEVKCVQTLTSTEANNNRNNNAIKTETIDPETEQPDKEKYSTSVEVIKPKDKDDKKSEDPEDNCVQPSTLIKATAINKERIDVEKPELEPADEEKSLNSSEVIKQKNKDDKKSDDSEEKCVQPSTLTDATEIKTETIDVENLQTKPTDIEKTTTSVEVIKPKDKDDNKSDNSEDKLNQPLTSEVTLINKEKMDVKKLEEAEPTDKEKPSTSSECIKPIDKGDKQSENSTEQFEVQPSTSTAPDITEETQEVEDRLGLLAESSRVTDDDDDEEDPEPEEDEPDDMDDDDFDPEAEDNSNQTEDHSEESNPPNSDIDIQEEGIDIEFSDVVKTAIDSYGTTFDSLLDSADLKVEDSDITMDASIDKEADNEMQKTSPLKEVPSTVKTEESIGTDNQTTDRARSLLADLLTKPAADMNLPKSGKVAGMQDSCVVVDLEESSSEEDGKVKEKAPSAVQNDQQVNDTDKDKNITKEVTKETKSTKTVTEILKESNKDKSKTAEILSLDSDDDDKAADKEVTFIQKPREGNKCINYNCTSDENVPYYLADRMTIAFYGAARKRRRPVCQNCLDVVSARNEGLVSGIKDLRPLMSLRMARPTQTLLEISDSDSDSEGEDDLVGEKGASLLEDQLADILNDVWSKYNMDDRFKETEKYLEDELEKMQKQSEEVDKLLRDCQMATDKLRVEFYSSFENPRKELPSMSIHDTPIASYACMESDEIVDEGAQNPQFSLRYPKRRSTTMIDTIAKKQATQDNKRPSRYNNDPMLKHEDDKDLTVVRLSAETAPSELPPAGEPSKPPLRVGALVFAMKNQYGAWLKGKVLEVQPKTPEQQFTMCRVRFEHKVKNPCKMLSARSIAYTEPCEVRMTIGTRVIALFKNSENTNKKGEFYYSGVIAEIPNPVNGYRYLVFFDDGYAQYVEHKHTRLVYESKPLVWEEVHPFSRDFVCNYLMKYPERPMVRLHPDQSVTVEWNGKWWVTKVVQVDAALVHIRFPDGRTEWIYRGSTRLQPLFTELQAARRTERTRMPRGTKTRPGAGRLDAVKANVPYVEYTRSDDPPKDESSSVELFGSSARSWELRRQRSVAKKSTTTIAQQIGSAATDGLGLVSRVVYYTPKNTVRPLKMVPHTCGPQCKRSDLLTLNDLRTYNPLTKPLLSGWERQIIRYKSSRTTMYRAPCGRRLRNERELHTYLRTIRSDMAVDLFDFDPNVHCLAEFVLNKSHVQKKDLSHGKENVPVPCVNYYDHSLPEFCSYNTERTPTSGVPLNLDPDFLCGCDCEDDCVDKTKCACWKMTLEGAKTIGIEGPNVGYHFRRLPEPLPSGIYECNSRCKCKSTCLNRVAQNPLQLKLQVFKTLNRGWGIRALNDIPKGAFICIYAGNLLTDATANLDGLNEGDEYLAELDYIEVVESMKEGYEDDIPEADKKIGKKNTKDADSEPETESSESEEEERADKTDTEDGDFRPAYMTLGLTEFNKRLRRRDKKKAKDEKEEEQKKDTKESNDDKTGIKKEDEECITISDDEEVRVSQREPSRFAAEELMTDNKIEPKYRSIRTYFGKDEACYIMDAKVQGNIGRYLNHSCCPNVFVQNVFVDTHDPRFPWVSFFALHHIRAGTELTWNYNYDIGSVPGKVLYCYCGAANCRGRLL